MTIVEFLLARIAEDEVVASEHVVAVAGAPRRTGKATALRDGGRMLAECKAKRAIVAEHVPSTLAPWCCGRCVEESVTQGDADALDHPCPTLRALVSVYADHPDYRDEWR